MDYKFIINRLRRMSIKEIFFRIKQKITLILESRYYQYFNFDSSYNNSKPVLINFQLENIDSKLLRKKADLLVNDLFDFFALKNFYTGPNIDFHQDYKSGLHTPRNDFGKGIDYRDSSKFGDIKYIWEINRHLFLLTLALAYTKFKDEKYLNKFEFFLNAWFDQNEFMKGVNWCSSLELGIRLINWTFCWILINKDIDSKFSTKWLDSIYRHCWFIERYLSAYSSANNHLIGEVSGLFITSSVFNGFNKSKKWRDLSYKKLFKECESQNYSDGVNKEQAVSYQQFVLDFLLFAGMISKTTNKEFPPSYWDRIEKMLEYLNAIEDLKGNMPQIGDEDDGYVVDLNQKEYGPYRSLLNTGAFLFNRSNFLKNDKHLDDKTIFLLNLGGINPSLKTKKIIIAGTNCKFPDGGYYILRADLSGKREQKMIFDCGPLGYLSISAHGHADALAFSFFAGGHPIFIDPGTYSYHTNEKWRNYFRSTWAHNTVTIDGQNQSVISGNFMWQDKANAALVEYKENYYVKGRHDGYLRLKDKTIHEREIMYNKQLKSWEIADEIFCSGNHIVNIFFHCFPDCKVIYKNKKCKITFPGGECILKFQPDLALTLHKGEKDTCLGWYSPSYDVKIPATTIKLEKEINGNEKIITGFEIKFK